MLAKLLHVSENSNRMNRTDTKIHLLGLFCLTTHSVCFTEMIKSLLILPPKLCTYFVPEFKTYTISLKREKSKDG